MLEAAGFKVAVGGNIGAPLSDQVSASTPEMLHVVETSSFSSSTSIVSSWIAVMLISPPTISNAPRAWKPMPAKARIFENQSPATGGRQRRRSVGPRARARGGRDALLRRREPIAEGTVIEERWIVDRREMRPSARAPRCDSLARSASVIDVMAAHDRRHRPARHPPR